jgi:hypothetical protein
MYGYMSWAAFGTMFIITGGFGTIVRVIGVYQKAGARSMK